MNRIHFMVSVGRHSSPEFVESMGKDPKNGKIWKRIQEICPTCPKMKTCQKGCKKIRGEGLKKCESLQPQTHASDTVDSLILCGHGWDSDNGEHKKIH